MYHNLLKAIKMNFKKFFPSLPKRFKHILYETCFCFCKITLPFVIAATILDYYDCKEYFRLLSDFWFYALAMSILFLPKNEKQDK